ncbi:hypothetical protein NDU88_006608, partial [Pleurodeles waltl]
MAGLAVWHAGEAGLALWRLCRRAGSVVQGPCVAGLALWHSALVWLCLSVAVWCGRPRADLGSKDVKLLEYDDVDSRLQ